MTITPEDVAKLREDGEPWCTTCGKRRSEHNYRHPFRPSHTSTLESAAHDMADLIAEQAREIAELRAQVRLLRWATEPVRAARGQK